MQQTQTCKFDLIETSDTFSPEPLNENMEKVEAQLAAVRAEAKAGDAAEAQARAALAQRVTVLEKPRFACGSYSGDGAKTRIIPLPFQPKAVLVFTNGVNGYLILSTSGDSYGVLTSSGFQVGYNTDLSASSLNHPGSNYRYRYLAFG